MPKQFVAFVLVPSRNSSSKHRLGLINTTPQYLVNLLKPRQISILSLVLLTAGTWAYLLGPTANYAHYYSAIEGLSVKIPRFVVTHTDSNVIVTMLFNVSNPTPYTGLTLASVSYQVLIQTPGNTVCENRFGCSGKTPDVVMGSSGAGPPQPVSLKPFSFAMLIGTIVLTGAKMDQYDMLAKQSGGAPPWHVAGVIDILGRDGFLTPEFDIPVTASST